MSVVSIGSDLYWVRDGSLNGRVDGDVLNDGIGIECWVNVSGFGLIVRFVIWAGVEELIAW